MHQDDLKERDEFILFFKIVLGKTATAARNLINYSPQTEATTFAFSYVFNLFLWFIQKTRLKVVAATWLVQNSLRGKKLKKLCPFSISDDLCLFFCKNPSSMVWSFLAPCPLYSVHVYSMYTVQYITLQATVRLHSCCMMTCTLNGGREMVSDQGRQIPGTTRF